MTAEVARTHAWRVPRGAELVGGPVDGLVVIASLAEMFGAAVPPRVTFLLSDGSQHTVAAREPVTWLHPERQRS